MPRRWIIALSLAWGLASGCVAALVTAVGLLAVGWVYLYGDDPWPAYFSERLVPIAAGAAGLFGLAIPGAVIALTRRSLPGLEGRLRTSSGLRWGFLVVPLLILGALLWAIQHQDVARERAAAEAERMIHRQEQMHRLETARWDLDPAAGRLRIELAAQGTTAGSYTLSWQARAPGASGSLGVGATSHSLPAGTAALSWELDAQALARAYAEAILSRAEAVEIDLPLTIELLLSPEQEAPSGSRLILRVSLAYHYLPDGTIRFINRDL
ncbi:MAG TPA: hypothetical protein VED46_12880 [Alphaproteobacteria bacterium]|nr:hypothetical protein [Alphaproteobacteria bacterium]